MNVSILHLKYEYGARSESRFKSMLLPFLRHVVPVNNGHLAHDYPTHLISACLNPLKIILLQ